MSATRVAVIGAAGRMGATVCRAVEDADDLELVGRFDEGDELGDLAGADVVMTASALLRHGVGHAGVLLAGLEDWMRRKGFARPEEFRGRLAVPVGVDQAAYERAGYVAALQKARSTYGHLADPWGSARVSGASR